jgi:inositol oxygenase
MYERGCGLDKLMFSWGHDEYVPSSPTLHYYPCRVGYPSTLERKTAFQARCGVLVLTHESLALTMNRYLYQILQNHGSTIPDEGLYMIRFHSFYPWHTGGTYKEFESEKDRQMLKWVNEFNKFDLYSKSDSIPDIEPLKPYYQGLVDKYMPGLIKF